MLLISATGGSPGKNALRPLLGGYEPCWLSKRTTRYHRSSDAASRRPLRLRAAWSGRARSVGTGVGTIQRPEDSYTSKRLISQVVPVERGSSPFRIEQYQGIVLGDQRAIGDEDLDDPPREVGGNLAEQLHRFDQSDRLAFFHPVSRFHERRDVGTGGAVEDSGHRRAE